MKKLLVALLMLALCVALSGCGDEEFLIEKSEDFYINDVADVLEYETRGVVYFNSKALDEACGAQIVVVTTRTLGNEDIEDFAFKLFNQWGIGDSKKNNGILLLMKPASSMADKNYFVATGTGAADIIGDAELKLLLDEYLYDDFAAGNYDRGTLRIYRALFERVRDYYNVNLAYSDETALIRTGRLIAESTYTETETETQPASGGFAGGRTNKTETRGGGFPVGWIIVIAIIVIVVIAMSRRRRSAGPARTVVTPVYVSTPRVRHTPPPVYPRSRGVTPPPAASQPYVYKSAPNTSRTYRNAVPRAGVFGSIFGASSVGRSSGSTVRPSASRSVSRPSVSSSRPSVSRPSSFGGGRSGGGKTSGGGAGMRR